MPELPHAGEPGRIQGMAIDPGTLDQWRASWQKAQDDFQNAVQAIQDSWTRADLAGKVRETNAAVTESGGIWKLQGQTLNNAADAAEKLQKAGARLTDQLTILASMASDKVKPGIDGLGEVLAATKVPTDYMTSAARALEQEISGANLLQKTKDLDAAITDLGGPMNLTGPQFERAAAAAAKLRDEGAKLTGQLQILAGMNVTTGIKDIDALLPGTAVNVKNLAPPIEKAHDALKLLKTSFDELGSAIGGDIGNAIHALGNMASAIDNARNAVSAAKNAFKAGDILGGLASAASGIMGIASAAIQAAGAVKQLWDHFFGTAGRDAVKDFAASMGGFDALHQQLLQLGASGEQMWIALTQGTGRNNAQQAQANIKAVQDALDQLHQSQNSQISDLISKIQSFGGSIDPALDPYIAKLKESGQLTADNAAALKALEGDGKPSYDTLLQLQQKYNLTAAQMGSAFQTQQISANFQTIINDLDTLTRGGANVTAALFTIGSDGSKSLSGLGQAVQGDIEAAIKAGVAIPANLKPAAQALFDQGDLVDSNGQKITDFNKIAFGEDMQTSLDNLNDTLKKLIDFMTNTDPTKGLTGAINAVPRHVDIQFQAHQTGDWPGSDGSSDGSGYNEPHYHAGTAYVQRFHRGTAKVLPFPFSNAIVAHSGLLPDEVPAILQTGESVLNRRAGLMLEEPMAPTQTRRAA